MLHAVIFPAVVREDAPRSVFFVRLLLDCRDPRGDTGLVPTLPVVLQFDLVEAAFGKIKQRAFESLLNDAFDDEQIPFTRHFFLHNLRLGLADHFLDAVDGFTPFHSEGRLDLLLGPRGCGGKQNRGEREKQEPMHPEQIRVEFGPRQAQALVAASFS